MLFIALSFGVAWLLWLAAWAAAERGVRDAPLTALVIGGSFAPFFAAGACVRVEEGWRGLLRFFSRSFDLRMGWFVLLVSLLLAPLLGIAAAAIDAVGHAASMGFQMGWSDLIPAYLWLLLLGGPVGEEFGWTYLSDRLDAFAPMPVSTALLGLIWALWHLPLFFLDVPGLAQRFIPFWLFCGLAFAMRFLFSWAYHRGGRNLLSNLLFHNGLNLALSVVVIVVPVAGASLARLGYLVCLSGLAALFLWRFIPPRNVSGQSLAPRDRPGRRDDASQT